MNSKKAITLLVLATLLMSALPLIQVSALSYTPLTATSTYNSEVTVTGSGVSTLSTVELYWDAIQPWNGSAGKVGAATGLPSGDWTVTFKVPSSTYGRHYVWAREIVGGVGATPEKVGYVDVNPSIKLSSSTGLPGDSITVSGYGFNASKALVNIWFKNPTNTTTKFTPSVDTDKLGAFTATFTVPKWVYGLNTVNATVLTLTSTPAVDFTIGPSISLSKKDGPSGTVVKITGRGFNATKSIDSIVTYNGTICKVVGTVTSDSTGAFTADVVIPYAGGANKEKLGEWDLKVNQTGAKFKITGKPKITATPAFQVQGGMFTLTGLNFTQIADKTVTVKLNGTLLGTAKTSSSGTFTQQFRVPAVTSGVYVLDASMTDYGINKTMSYRVGIMLVILSTESGPTGEQVTVTATGFTESGEWNMTIGGKRPAEVGATNPVLSTGSLSKVITIPTLPVGVHTVSVYDIDADISVETEFEVTQTTSMTADPVQVPNKFNVTLTGKYFTDEPVAPDDELEWWVYNSTGAWSMNVWNTTTSNPAKLLSDGTFKGTWTVPTTLAIGTYTVNVTDGNGLWAKLTFNVVDKTVSIDARKSVFRIGETVYFDVESSFAVENSYIKIWDPSGNLYWMTDLFSADNWVSLTLTKIVPFYSQTAGGNPMMLLDDAPLGQYTWTWYDGTVDHDELDSGSFTVEAAAADVIGEQVADLANQLTDLQDSLADVTSEFDDVKSDIANVAAVAQQAVTAAQQAAQAVQTVAQTANQANTAAQNAADAANAAKDAANSLTTLVYGAIGAALVAALAAIVSLMQISRRIAG